MKLLSYVFIIFTLMSGCKGGSKGDPSKEELEALFEQESNNQKRALLGNGKHVSIEVVSDPAKFEPIRKDILSRIEKRNKEENLQIPPLGERYLKGDKTTIPLMVSKLKSGDAEARQEIYSSLRNGEDHFEMKDQELINAIYSRLNDPLDQDEVIQVAGFHKFPGHIVKFEEILTSGKTKDPDRLIFWLSSEGSSQKGFDYLKKQILEGNPEEKKLASLLNYLRYFSKSKNASIRKGCIDICMVVYSKKMIPAAKFEEMKTSISSDNAASQFLDILFESGDERTVPIAKDMFSRNINRYSAIRALIRLEGNKHKSLLFDQMNDKDQFRDLLPSVEELYVQTKDNMLAKEMLLKYEKHKLYERNLAGNVAECLVKLNNKEYLDHPEKVLTDPKLIELIKSESIIISGNARSMADDLFGMGVIDRKYDEQMLKTLENKPPREDEFDIFTSYRYYVLEHSGIYLMFDAETGMLPVDYDKVLMDMANNSGGKLNDVQVWMDVTGPDGMSIDNFEDQPIDTIKYKITLLANQKAYIAEPEDIGDWYDVQFLLDLMNKVAADAGLQERYSLLNNGDQVAVIIFGPEEAVKKLAVKYNL